MYPVRCSAFPSRQIQLSREDSNRRLSSGRFFEQADNKNVQLHVFHATWTFTNTSSGETFVFQEVKARSRIWLVAPPLSTAQPSPLGYLAAFEPQK
jgi:hypothetical protein